MIEDQESLNYVYQSLKQISFESHNINPQSKGKKLLIDIFNHWK